MATNEQTAAEEEKRIHALKMDCLNSVRAFNEAKERGEKTGEPDPAEIKLLQEYADKFDALCGCVESCIASSDLLGANRSKFWAKELANTATNMLDTIPEFYEKQWSEAERLDQPALKPSPNAFSAMQNAVKAYNPDQVDALKERFDKLKLPVRGFTHSEPMNTMYERWEKITIWATIIIGLALLFAVAVFKKDWDVRGFYIVRTILAIVAGAFAAVAIPGFLEVNLKIKKNFKVRAIGATAVFVIVYLINPPNIPPDKKAEAGPPAARSSQP